ncbi:hypothetical protein KAR28_06135 [Candidatus Parcubacteria bacterium]|nr:hypothetical protein [Candidatus Parcubacteria bacterium]
MSNFQQTVNLKKTTEKPEETPVPRERSIKKNKVIKKQRFNKAEAIDEVYQTDKLDIKSKPELKQFERMDAKPVNESMYKRLSIILIMFLAAGIFYFLFFPLDNNKDKHDAEPKWYMVKLMNNEIYYGLISDTAADPVIINSVYYNYDQLNSEDSSLPESGNLRLVKRGKETHGPSGTLSVVRAQVVFMEPLTEESKVLKAILNYEK